SPFASASLSGAQNTARFAPGLGDSPVVRAARRLPASPGQTSRQEVPTSDPPDRTQHAGEERPEDGSDAAKSGKAPSLAISARVNEALAGSGERLDKCLSSRAARVTLLLAGAIVLAMLH